jgi:flagellar biogenesis protein FliO
MLTAGAAVAQSTQPATGGLIHRAGSASTPPTTQAASSSAKSMSNSASMLRVVFSLAAVLGLIALMYWASRRMMPGRFVGEGGGIRAVQVLARAPLSPRHRVVLLQVGRRVLVVAEGTGQQPLNTLCEITDPDEAAALIGQVRSEQSNAKSFSALLTNAAERFRTHTSETPQASPTTAPAEDQLAATQQELDGLTQRVRGLARHFERA